MKHVTTPDYTASFCHNLLHCFLLNKVIQPSHGSLRIIHQPEEPLPPFFFLLSSFLFEYFPFHYSNGFLLII